MTSLLLVEIAKNFVKMRHLRRHYQHRYLTYRKHNLNQFLLISSRTVDTTTYLRSVLRLDRSLSIKGWKPKRKSFWSSCSLKETLYELWYSLNFFKWWWSWTHCNRNTSLSYLLGVVSQEIILIQPTIKRVSWGCSKKGQETSDFMHRTYRVRRQWQIFESYASVKKYAWSGVQIVTCIDYFWVPLLWCFRAHR